MGICCQIIFVNPLTVKWALRALIDFTLSNARRFYSSMGYPLDGKGLNASCKKNMRFYAYYTVVEYLTINAFVIM